MNDDKKDLEELLDDLGITEDKKRGWTESIGYRFKQLIQFLLGVLGITWTIIVILVVVTAPAALLKLILEFLL